MKIEWTEPALLDLENIRDYIAADSEYYAIRFVERIIAATEILEHFPLVGRTVPEADEDTVRELLFRHYRIIYRAESDRILIITVLHGGRDLEQVEPKPWDIV